MKKILNNIWGRNIINFELYHRTWLYEAIEKGNTTAIENAYNFFFSNSEVVSSILKVPIRSCLLECTNCGQMFSYILDGDNLYESYKGRKINMAESCIDKDYTNYYIDINIPTGEILCADSLPYGHEVFKDIRNRDTRISVNSYKGCYDETMEYAKLNALHMYVGNTCPSLYKSGNTLVVGRPTVIETDEEEIEVSPLENSEEIGWICTDLWWASIIDFSIYKELLIKTFGEEEGLKKIEEITPLNKKIKPGVYRCYYLYKDNSDEINEFIKIEWLKEID